MHARRFQAFRDDLCELCGLVVVVVIVQKQLMVFFFLQMGAHECGKLVDHLFYLKIFKTRNEGVKQLITAEQAKKKDQRPFIGHPVQAETDCICRYG